MTIQHNLASLATKLGNGADWDYTGNVYEGDINKDQCACGHAIKFCFEVKHKTTGQIETLGSVCINHYFLATPAIIEKLNADMERLMKEKEEKEKATKELLLDEEINNIKNTILETKKSIDTVIYNISNGRFFKVPYELYRSGFTTSSAEIRINNKPTDYCFKLKTYKTKKGLLNWIKKELTYYSELLEIAKSIGQM